MTRYFSIAVWIFLVSGNFAGNAAAREGIVVKVLDGDSLRVQTGGTVREIRLYGIDAPEYGQAYGKRARKYAGKLADHRPVNIEAMDIDRYGRIVALVWTAEHLLNRELVRAGLAWYYPRYCRRQPLCSELERLQAEARRKGQGLWAESEPVSPWQWKKNRRQLGSEATSGRYFSVPDWERILLCRLDRFLEDH